jgi:hypothetical protein
MLRVLVIFAALIFFDASYYHGRMLVRPTAKALIYGTHAVQQAAYRAGL